MRIHLGDTSRTCAMRLATLLLLATQLASFAGSISAAEAKPLRLTIQPLTGRARSQAPQAFELTLANQADSLVEGELELSIYLGRRLTQKFRSDPLVLGPDPHRFRILLPPIALHSEQTPVTAVGRFVGNRRTYDLDEHDLVIPPQWKRWFVLAISRPDEEAAHRDRFSIEMALAAERFNQRQGDLTDLLTTPAVLPPASLPTTSAGYAAFDVVLLEGGGFSQLRDGQLSALAAWVEAGGSVVVRPTEALPAGHLSFLNRLAASIRGVEPYQLDERGHLDRAAPALAAPVARYYSGLGRTVVLHQPRDRDEDFSSEDWIETAMFVWKVRADQQAEIRSSSYWNFVPPPFSPNALERPKPFAPQILELETALRSMLIPENVQGLPFWVVVAILTVFLLLIAPGDYFLLGALRARRFTWFSLTATSLAFTFGTVRITEKIMGTTDYRRGLVFADLGAEGRPVRTSRYELLFTATQKQLETRFQNELYVGIDDRVTRPASVRSRGGYYNNSGFPEDEAASPSGLAPDLPEYFGKLPADYVVRQQMRQWSPLVSRQTSFGGSTAVPEWNWDELGALPWERAEGRRQLRKSIEAVEPKARVLLFHGVRMFDLASEPDEESSLSTDVEAGAGAIGAENSNLAMPAARPAPAGSFQPVRAPGGVRVVKPPDPLIELIRRSCVGPEHGLFSIVSQIGPTGGDGVEDLAVLDSSDDAQWLLVVIVPRGEDRVVFRKLCRRGG